MIREKIGFIGLGIMGSAMAAHLLRAGYSLSLYARRAEQLTPLLEMGATKCGSPAEVAKQVSILCINVTNGSAVEEVLFGEQGAAAFLVPSAVVIVFATISPAEVRAIQGKLAPRSIHLLDAPVTGGDVGARNATLTIMVGGEAGVVNRVQPILSHLGKRIVHVGSVGNGQLMKAANQIGVALGIAAMTEAMVFAERSGLDPSLVVDVLRGGAAGSWAFENYAPRVLSGNDAPGFRAEDMLKDLRIASAEGQQHGCSLPATETLITLYEGLIKKHPGMLGNHALHRVYRSEK
jgi:3-hydroxyisobutyrate dehydrogenase-like beta-hydroxyacid dehydrogenase